ncbi:MAG: hypothetical protein M5R41_07205 [Bacteroidia bacterium]|nr:hypothetical protein [Bacteroidia bacterium]
MRPDDPIEEKDWKYMRSIRDELLHTLCARINDEAVAIATRPSGNPHERYLALFRHIKDSDNIVAVCFNDWRRSTLHIKIRELRFHGLLPDTHVRQLSNKAQTWLARLEAGSAL